ncbi:tRNA pseudouridine(38-40) synthase TruA [Salinisphaera sp. USBA-960]|uniref:tRNA pseudouridine(38-40) synthase TruA n=1 Tax=Salinisphaera orenii TaxID=856731 RepID=UPI000DBE9998|nr:tRNA pseudouridine(38-40) synthase TruA [Salifodinibacter halophilus]NNC26103.1 tRNA pseudouridine(38-40) synthase TruA [Salifodinibacter halophilus]
MRWAAAIEYDGGAYHGWQRQPGHPTIQAEVEHAIGRVANAPITVVCSGRTDAGVHAGAQIVHFDSSARRSADAWLLGSNRYLPPDIAPQWFVPVADDFHARYDAYARDYHYALLDRPAPTALWRNRAWHVHHRLDIDAMREAAQVLIGEHDFSAFRASACQAHTPWRNLHHVWMERNGDWLSVCIRANAFLHHMVRNIVGSLVQVGRGRREPAWLGAVLAGKDRRLAGATAPAHGLTLMHVHYPSDSGLPRASVDTLDTGGQHPMAGEC